MWQTRTGSLRPVVGGLLGAALCVFASNARALVTEPDGTLQVPIDYANSADLLCCNNTVNNMTLDALFKSRGEAIDYRADAHTDPAVFSPLCGLSGAMVMHGGGCRMDFGWYCTSDAADPPVVHPIVTAAEVLAYHDGPDTPDVWKNGDKAFVPKVGQIVAGQPLGNLRDTPEFQACQSQKIGFAVRPIASEAVCTMAKYSEPSRNQKCTLPACGGKPWIAAVVYASTVTPGGFYVAIEDLPTSPTDFKAPVPGKGWQADGDFNDFVYFVQGIQCEGGGQPCTPVDAQGTPLLGACAAGVTACSATIGQPGECRPRIAPQPERCDNADNDCNGKVDDGPALCDPGYVCDHGKCVGACGHGEFKCATDLVCESQGPLAGYCVEPACTGVVCGENKVCRAGQCVGGCDGVTCPAGQECVLGACIDPCKDTACPDGFVCVNGACITSCRCLPCPSGQECAANGRCTGDVACKNVTCAQGLVCKTGQCVDPCAGVVCPGGVTCVVVGAGAVCPPPSGTSGAGGAGSAAQPDSGFVFGTTGGGSGYAGAGTSSVGPTTDRARAAENGCGCRAAGGGNARLGWSGTMLALAAIAMRRRTRALAVASALGIAACAAGDDLETSRPSAAGAGGAGGSTAAAGGATSIPLGGSTAAGGSTGPAGGGGGSAGSGGAAIGSGGSAAGAGAAGRASTGGSLTTVVNIQIGYRATSTGAQTSNAQFELAVASRYPMLAKDLTIRYWFTRDGLTPEVVIDASDFGAALKTRFVNLDTPRATADTYLELSFTGGLLIDGDLKSTTVKPARIQARIAPAGYQGQWNQANDYSFVATGDLTTDAPTITAYYGAALVHGVEPGP